MSVYLDVMLWVILLFTFFISYGKSKPLSFTLIFLIFVNGLYSFLHHSESAAYWSNITSFAFLALALFFARHSPNYAWLLGGILIVKLIDVSFHTSLKAKGTVFYAAIALYDFLIILLIRHRGDVTRFFASKNIPVISPFARRSVPALGLSVHELWLMGLYGIAFAIDALSLVESLIRDFTSAQPTFIYSLFPFVKMPLAVATLITIFALATGLARGIATQRRIA